MGRDRRALTRVAAMLASTVLAIAAIVAWQQLPVIGAGALLHAARRAVTEAPPARCREVSVAGAGVTLRGWRCDAGASSHEATLVWLHGRGDNRTSSRGAIARFVPRGYTVLAYDSRAHGASDGEACTYGYHEKHDLRAVLDTAPPGPVILIGGSLGAAVALQLAAEDPRVSAVVAAETFADLRSIATERAPWFFVTPVIDRAFARAETWGKFEVDAVSPVEAARHIRIPVLLLHGKDDAETSPTHSQRVFAALAGPRRLILVTGAGHNGSLGTAQWDIVEQWLNQHVPTMSHTAVAR